MLVTSIFSFTQSVSTLSKTEMFLETLNLLAANTFNLDKGMILPWDMHILQQFV